MLYYRFFHYFKVNSIKVGILPVLAFKFITKFYYDNQKLELIKIGFIIFTIIFAMLFVTSFLYVLTLVRGWLYSNTFSVGLLVNSVKEILLKSLIYSLIPLVATVVYSSGLFIRYIFNIKPSKH